MMSEDEQDEELPQLSGGNGEEVDRDQIPDTRGKGVTDAAWTEYLEPVCR